jgi:hypothetical protein
LFRFRVHKNSADLLRIFSKFLHLFIPHNLLFLFPLEPYSSTPSGWPNPSPESDLAAAIVELGRSTPPPLRGEEAAGAPPQPPAWSHRRCLRERRWESPGSLWSVRSHERSRSCVNPRLTADQSTEYSLEYSLLFSK